MTPGNSVLVHPQGLELLSTWPLRSSTGSEVSGATVRVMIVRASDRYVLDHADHTFKIDGGSSPQGNCTELLLPGGNTTGIYTFAWNLAAITNPIVGDVYQVHFKISSGSAAVNTTSMSGEVRTWLPHNLAIADALLNISPGDSSPGTVGANLTNLDAAVSSRAVADDVPSAEDVAAKVLSSSVAFGASGSVAEALETTRKLLRNPKKIIGQNLVIYELNGVTPWLTLPLADINGGVIAPRAGEPAQIGAATTGGSGGDPQALQVLQALDKKR
jgi:hypothetical protein